MAKREALEFGHRGRRVAKIEDGWLSYRDEWPKLEGWVAKLEAWVAKLEG